MSAFKVTNLLRQVSFIAIPKNSTFKSSLSLDKLYPNSVNVVKFEAPKPTENFKFNGYIPVEELDITFTRSSGAGGQHVNKTNSKVDVRFHIESAKWLANSLKAKLIEQHSNKINREGYFIIRSEKTRCQLLNQGDAMARLRDILYKLEQPELTLSPETEEKIRKNKEKANRMRLMEKRMRSSVKSSRNSEQL